MAGLLSGVLPAIYSASNGLKRRVNGLLSDPMGTVAQTVNDANDRAGGLLAVTRAAAKEGALGNGPATQQLTNMLIDAYNPVGMFIGPNAKTWDKTAAQLAQKLDASGADPRAIWKQTGTFKGPDGKWRQEIDDSVADVPRYGKHILRPLEEAMLHEPLEAAYPSVKNIMFETSPGSVRSGAEYRPNVKFHQFGDRESIVIRNSEESAKQNKSLALHELQHAIQQREGFAKGGNPQQFNPLTGDYEAYLRLAGEAEARATQARMNMGMQQRRDLFPLDSYDVPIDQLILR